MFVATVDCIPLVSWVGCGAVSMQGELLGWVFVLCRVSCDPGGWVFWEQVILKIGLFVMGS